jgi:hypothetical protein
VWRKSALDIYFTEFGTALTTILPILFQYSYKYCYLVQQPVSQIKMTFQEIRIIATGPCKSNQWRDVNTICRRSWYIAAHIWKIYDFKIEVVSFIIKFPGTSSLSEKQAAGPGLKKFCLIRSLKRFIFRYQDLVEIYSISAETIINVGFSYSENV